MLLHIPRPDCDQLQLIPRAQRYPKRAFSERGASPRASGAHTKWRMQRRPQAWTSPWGLEPHPGSFNLALGIAWESPGGLNLTLEASTSLWESPGRAHFDPWAPKSIFGSQNASWGPSGSQFLATRFF